MLPGNVFKIRVIAFEKLMYYLQKHGFDPTKVDYENDKYYDTCYITEEELDKAKVNQAEATSIFEENALFYQIMYELDFPLTNNKKVSNVINELIYLDFSSTNAKSLLAHNSYMMEILFKKGFEVRNSGTTIYCFVPFEKSASMGRQSRISFISKIAIDLNNNVINDFDKRMQKRSRLELNEKVVNDVALSKRYAYRGLVLSGGKKVDLGDFKLDTKNVLLVPDFETDSPAMSYFTQKAAEKQNFKNQNKITIDFGTAPEIKTEEKEENINDGYGFIGEKLANIIDSNFQRDARGNIKTHQSYQIRLPYVKGVVHRIDYKDFFKQHAVDGKVCIRVYNEQLEKTTKEFTIEQINNIELILTKSMFKVYKELKQYYDKYEEELFDDYKVSSAMEFYFNRFHYYKHSLFVLTVDKPNQEVDQHSKTNYQFLSTVKLSEKDFDKLYKDSDKELIDFKTNEKKRIQFFTNQEENEEVDESIDVLTDSLFGSNLIDDEDNGSSNSLNNQYELEAKLLKINPDFINEPHFKNILANRATSMKKDLGIGKLIIDGTDRFLLGDPLWFLYYLVGQENEFNEKLPDNTFMLPGYEKIKRISSKVNKKKEVECAILRNPHLSRNEDLVLTLFIPEKGSERDIYLSNLTGTCIIDSTHSSLPAETVSGADFDGDHVKVYFNEDYVNAIKKQRLDDPEDGYPLVINKDYEKDFKSSDSKQYEDNEYNKYKVNLQTFDNSVGMISNDAFKESLLAYGTYSDVVKLELKTDAEIKRHKNAVRLLGILTGVEVDSCKTGLKPKTLTVRASTLANGKNKKMTYLFDIHNQPLKSGENIFIEHKNFINGAITKKEIKDGYRKDPTLYEKLYEEKKLDEFKKTYQDKIGRDPSNVETLIPRYITAGGGNVSSSVPRNIALIPWAPTKVLNDKGDKKYIYKGALYESIAICIQAYQKLVIEKSREKYQEENVGVKFYELLFKVSTVDNGEIEMRKLLETLSDPSEVPFYNYRRLINSITNKSLVYNYYNYFAYTLNEEKYKEKKAKAIAWLKKIFEECNITLTKFDYQLLTLEPKIIDYVLQNVSSRRRAIDVNQSKMISKESEIYQLLRQENFEEAKEEEDNKENKENKIQDFMDTVLSSYQVIKNESSKILQSTDIGVFEHLNKTISRKFDNKLFEMLDFVYSKEAEYMNHLNEYYNFIEYRLDAFIKFIKNECSNNKNLNLNKRISEFDFNCLERLKGYIIDNTVCKAYQKFKEEQCKNQDLIDQINKLRSSKNNKSAMHVFSKYDYYKNRMNEVQKNEHRLWKDVLNEIVIEDIKTLINYNDNNYASKTLDHEMIRYVRALEKEYDPNQSFLFNCLGDILLKDLEADSSSKENHND